MNKVFFWTEACYNKGEAALNKLTYEAIPIKHMNSQYKSDVWKINVIIIDKWKNTIKKCIILYKYTATKNIKNLPVRNPTYSGR